MKIAFASTDGKNLNEHFGCSLKYYIYSLDESEYNFEKEINASTQIEDHTDKLQYKIDLLKNCDILCVIQIGPGASTMVKQSGLYPLTSKEEPIEDVLKKLQEMLKENTPLWLKRILLKG